MINSKKRLLIYPDGTRSDGGVAFSRLPPSCRYRAEGRRRIQLHQKTDHFPSRYTAILVYFPHLYLKASSKVSPIRSGAAFFFFLSVCESEVTPNRLPMTLTRLAGRRPLVRPPSADPSSHPRTRGCRCFGASLNSGVMFH